MKNILLLLFGLFFSIVAFAQEKQSLKFDRQAIYKMTYRPDTGKSSIKEEYMELLLNDSLSLFESITKRRIDSLELLRIMNENYRIASLPYSYFHYQVLKQNNANAIITFDVLDNETSYRGPNHYYYTEDKESFQWEIKEDTLKINNLLCQKAEVDFGNRKWVAWFTTEIPISDGPYKFSGLPGLIVKINDTENFWNFELVRLEPTSKVITINFKEDKQPVLTTKREFLANKKHYRENSLQIKEMYGFKIISGRSEMQKSANDFNKSHNNWIEMPF